MIYYLNTPGTILERYKNYNGVEGIPVDINANRGSTTVPDVEDINRDNTMNTINAMNIASMSKNLLLGRII
jgi:cell surface protein SprA